MLAVSAILTACASLGWITPWLLLFFTFLIGCGTALNNPSWQASVGDMVPRDDLPDAVTLNSMGFNLTRSVGPAIGGVIVATAGAAAAFAVNTLSYFAMIFALIRWSRQCLLRSLPREISDSAISAGLRYVSMSPNLEKVLVRGLIFGIGASSILALLPIVAHRSCRRRTADLRLHARLLRHRRNRRRRCSMRGCARCLAAKAIVRSPLPALRSAW